MRVLFFALEFPPVATTGMHRSAKLVRYLPELGVEPIVITLEAEDAARWFGAPCEPELSAELPSQLVVHRLPIGPPQPPVSRVGRFLDIFLRLEDDFAKRLQPALDRALPEIVRQHAPQAVYVSMPPFSTGKLAARVAERLGLPLVVDMRDGWSHYCPGAFPSYAHWRLTHRREHRLFERARAVVTVTRQLADVFRRTHPELPAERFHVIENGYDGTLELPDVIEVPPRRAEESITIGYIGRFYYDPLAREHARLPWWRRPGHRKLHYRPVDEDWLYRTPHFLFRAMAELRRRAPALGPRLRFTLVGQAPQWWQAMVGEHGLGDAVSCLGHVPNRDLARITAGFDAQLCTSVKVEGGQDYALASKTFDYVRAGRPIVGLVTRGSQREFLERSGLALLADPDDLDACVGVLERLARGGFSLAPDRAFLAQFHRRALAARMVRVLESAMLG